MISILMPLYNGIEFIEDSISSIIGQSYRDWELLIGINGHHPDDEHFIDGYYSIDGDGYVDGYHFITAYDKIMISINKFASDKIKVITYDWKSKTKTLNALAQQARYNYICLIDVDDYWFPEKLKKQLDVIGGNPGYDVVGSDAAYFSNKLGTPGLFLGKLTPKMFIFQNPIMNSAVMMKKEYAKWDEAWEGLDDYQLWTHLVKQGKTFYNVPEILINHRIHERSYFNSNNEWMRIQLLESLDKLSEEEHAELTSILYDKKWNK